MKILLLPTSYPDEKNTSRNVFIYEQAVALANAGHDLRILHPQKLPSNKVLSRISTDIQTSDDGYAIRYFRPVKTFMEGRVVAFNKRAFSSAAYALYDYATSDGWKPDVIYAHFSCWAGYAAVKIGKKHKIPVAVMEHFGGYLSEEPLPARHIEGLKYVVDNADSMMCVSKKLKDSVLRLAHSDRLIYVIPNMVNPAFHYFRHDFSNPFVFVALCNLNNGKRVNELVEAFCKSFNKDEKVELIIGGDGPERKRIANTIYKYQRDHQIKLVGRLDRKGTIDLYKQANCFALVSAHETFGIVWREAMATGLPIITSNHEGWSNGDWSDDFGIMVPVDDEACLIQALKHMRENYGAYDGKRISDRCMERYSEGVIVKKIEKVLMKVCGRVLN